MLYQLNSTISQCCLWTTALFLYTKYIAWIGVLKHSKMNLVDMWLQIVREIQRWYGFDWQVWWNTNDNNDQVRCKHVFKKHLSYELPYVCESRCQTLQIFSHRIVRHKFFPVYHFLVCLNILIEQITRRLNLRTVYCWWYYCCTSNTFLAVRIVCIARDLTKNILIFKLVFPVQWTWVTMTFPHSDPC